MEAKKCSKCGLGNIDEMKVVGGAIKKRDSKTGREVIENTSLVDETPSFSRCLACKNEWQEDVH